MVYAALAGAVLTILLRFVAGVRDPERDTTEAPGLVLPVPGNPEQDAL